MSDMIAILRAQEWASAFQDDELAQLASVGSVENYGPGTTLITEGTTYQELLCIDSGVVEICKGVGGPNGPPQALCDIEAPACIGELAFLDQGERQATVRTKSQVRVLRLCRQDLESLALPPVLIYKLRASLGNAVIQHLRKADTSFIEEVKTRDRFGRFIVLVLLVFVLQNFATTFFQSVSSTLPPKIVQNIVLGVASFACIFFIHSLKRPLSFFGISLVGWKKALSEGFGLSILLTLLAFGLGMVGNHEVLTNISLELPIIFFFSALLQEFICHGVFQTSLQEFYKDPKGVWAVPLTALAVSSMYITPSWETVLYTFFSTLGLGFLYIRHRNLIGVTILSFTLKYLAVFWQGI